MAGSKKAWAIEFDGFDEVLSRLKKLDGDAKTVTEKALIATHGHITPDLHSLMKPHKRTGKTEASIVEKATVNWNGTIAKVDVGFDITKGGFPSVFLMYGTKGTPRHRPTKADSKLKNAIFGSKVKTEIMRIQEDIFYDEIRRLTR